MSTQRTCERCGRPLSVLEDVAGQCPSCMLELGLGAEPDPPSPSEHETGERESGSEPLPRPNAKLSAGVMVGRYRIIRLLGEGGMGVVYEAEQDRPRRTVALKLIKPGVSSPDLLRRFEQEAQALGRLQHPGIAQIYEAGTAHTDFGPQPYFAMEYIRGTTLREYADERHLNARERMEIVARVCDAVQHAHQRGLIHRDLKPGNIMVDETGQPKILDFGVARLAGAAAHVDIETRIGEIVGTITYMSPEQVQGDPLDLDTRSDVYALGVIFYELLSGQLPYKLSNLVHEAIYAIREEGPFKLSSLDRAYRGDIETIAAKALEKDKTRRYGSASDFGSDITRFLRNEPIVARPPSVRYQLQKFAHRHKALVAGVASVLFVLVGAVVFSSTQSLRASRAERIAIEEAGRAHVERDRANENERIAKAERDRTEDEKSRALAAEEGAKRERDSAITQKERADNEAAIAKAVQEFLGNDLLRMADPYLQQTTSSSPFAVPESVSNPNITVKELLDRAARNIGNRFQKQPLVEAAIRETIAETYSRLGQNQEARLHFENAVNLRRQEQGSAHPDCLNAMLKLATVYNRLRLPSESEAVAREIISSESLEGAAPFAARAINLLTLIQGNGADGRGTDDAAAFLRTFINDYRKRLGESHSTTVGAVSAVVRLYTAQTRPRYDEAEAFLKELIEDRRRGLGDNHPITISTVNQLIRLYTEQKAQGANAKAESFLRARLEAQPRSVGPATLANMDLLMQVYFAQPQPKYAEAETLVQRLLADAHRTPAGSEDVVMRLTSQLARVYLKQNKFKETESLLAPLVTGTAVNRLLERARTTRESSTAILDCIDLLVQAHEKLGKTAESEALGQTFRKVMESVLGFSPELPLRLEAENLSEILGRMFTLSLGYTRRGKEKEAEELRSTLATGYRRVSETHPAAFRSSVSTFLRYLSAGLFGRGEPAVRLTRNVLEFQEAEVGPAHPATIPALTILAGLYVNLNEFEEAHFVAKRLIDVTKDSLGFAHPSTQLTMMTASTMYEREFRSLRSKGRLTDIRKAAEKAVAFHSEWSEALSSLSESALAALSVGPGFAAAAPPLSHVASLGLGGAQAMAGNFRQAEDVFKRLHEEQKRAPNVTPETRLNTLVFIGWAQYHQENYAAAEQNLSEALRGFEQAAIRNGSRYGAMSNLGATLTAQKRFSEAESLLIESYETLKVLGPSRGQTDGAGFRGSLFVSEETPGERILKLYEDWGKPEKVTEWKQKFQAGQAEGAAAGPPQR